MEKLSIIERTVDYQERIEENVYLQSDVDELALKLWQQYATGESSDELLSQALQNEGLTINSACSKIKVLDAYAAINREDNLWLKDIEAIIEKYKVGFDSIAGLFDSKGALELCILLLI